MSFAQRYELGERLGGGGEAQVFRARERTTGREVAVRFEPAPEEARPPKIPEPYHAGWVRSYESGHDAELGRFITFELLEGETLSAQVARGPLDPDAGRHFARQALEAVGALHEAGWVHGDLNGDNFLLQRDATWKLLDLPFHCAVPPEARPAAFGSIYTLAPEQLDGRAPDARSDLFSLGCLFYYAACGVYPHAGGSEADIAIGRLRFPAVDLATRAPRYPHAFNAGVMRLVARRPEDRPSCATAAYQLLTSVDPSSPPVP